MKYYIIKAPYLSAGLRRSYNKQLEVHEMVISEESNFLQPTGVYTYKKGEWIYKKLSSTTMSIYKTNINDKVITELDLNNLNNLNNNIIYTDLELAKITKFLLIGELKNQYQREIASINDLMEKNIPDLSEEIKLIKDEYAEYFI